MYLLRLFLVFFMASAISGQAPNATVLVCPEGYSMVGDKCYLVSQDRYSADGGNNFCLGNNGSASVIESAAEMNLLAEALLTTDVYLGVKLVDRQKAFESALLVAGNSGYTNFNVSQPDNEGGEDCVVAQKAYDFRWVDVRCSESFQVLCETPAVEIILKVCAEDAYRYDNATCFWASDKNDTIVEGRKLCNERQMEVASIHSSDEEKFILLNFGTNLKLDYLWIGLNDQQVEGNFKWSDETPLDYENWWTGEPNNYFGVEDCVGMGANYTHQRWVDLGCDQKHRVVCRGPTFG